MTIIRACEKRIVNFCDFKLHKCYSSIYLSIYQFIKISNLKNGIDPSRSEDPLNHLIKQKCRPTVVERSKASVLVLDRG